MKTAAVLVGLSLFGSLGVSSPASAVTPHVGATGASDAARVEAIGIGDVQTFTTPGHADVVVGEGVAYARLTIAGGDGGDSNAGTPGGRGALLSGVIAVTPGQRLDVYVAGAGARTDTAGPASGGAGWYQGGASGGDGGGGGGGASAVGLGGKNFLVAGGGGGAGGQGEFGTDAYRGGQGGTASSQAGSGEDGHGPSTCLPRGGAGGGAPGEGGANGGAGTIVLNGGGGGGGAGVKGGGGGGGGKYGGCSGAGGGAGTSQISGDVRVGTLAGRNDTRGGGFVAVTLLAAPDYMKVDLAATSLPIGAATTATASLPSDATGTVRFASADGRIDFGTVAVAGGAAAAPINASDLGAGISRITAFYSGDARFWPTSHSSDPLTVSPAASAPILTIADPRVASGGRTSVTVSLAADAQGSVAFTATDRAGNVASTSTVDVASGLATITLPAVADGEYRVGAAYSGDSAHLSSTTNTVVWTVGDLAPAYSPELGADPQEHWEFTGGTPVPVTVPAGVTAADFVVIGGTGGHGYKTARGGHPASVVGRVLVTPGETLDVIVAGGGSSASSTSTELQHGGPGWGAGGNADGIDTYQNDSSASGAGASAVSRGGVPLIVAGGGGGAGALGVTLINVYESGSGGDAGAEPGNGTHGGGPDTAVCRAFVGTGGTQPGAAGGRGQTRNSVIGGPGGGGGGGYRGGGGGGAGGVGDCAGSGGGAGSSYAAAEVIAPEITTMTSPATNNGVISVTWVSGKKQGDVVMQPLSTVWGNDVAAEITVPQGATGEVRLTTASGINLGTTAITPGTATVSIGVPSTMLGVGTTDVMAQYFGDATFKSAQSEPVSMSVNVATPTLTLHTDPGTGTASTPRILTAVLPGDAGSSVVFLSNDPVAGPTILGESDVVAGIATLAIDGPSAGTQLSVTARYVGDARYAPVVSSATTVATPPVPTVTVPPEPEPGVPAPTVPAPAPSAVDGNTTAQSPDRQRSGELATTGVDVLRLMPVGLTLLAVGMLLILIRRALRTRRAEG